MTEQKQLEIINELLSVLNKYAMPSWMALTILNTTTAMALKQIAGNACADRYTKWMHEFIAGETNRRKN